MPKRGSLYVAGKTEEHIGKGIFSRLTSTVYPHFFYRLTSRISLHRVKDTGMGDFMVVGRF